MTINFAAAEAALADMVQEGMARLGVPGLAIGLLHGDETYTVGFGVTNLNHPLPVEADTLFQIGSTSKTITATTAMRLVEMGQLDLEAPIKTYLPDLRLADEAATDRATLSHLFTHTGGWLGDYFDDFGRGDDALTKMVAAMAKLPQLTPLGQIWSYNNAGFYLAGRIIEAVTGQTYEAAVKELVLDPLGMTHSVFLAEEAIIHRVAVGHIVYPDRVEVAQPWALARTANPAGGVISNVTDQLRYARFHLGDGRAADGQRLLRPESLAAMQTPRAAAGSMAEEVGLTWLMRRVAGTRLVMHGGATNGQLSAFVLVPERQFALTVLTNANRGRELNAEITAWALQHYLGLAEPEATPLTLSTAALAEYAGHYQAALSKIDLSLSEGTLWLQSIPQGGFPKPDSPPGPTPPPVRLAFSAEDRVIGLDPPFTNQRGEFLRDEAGRIVWFRFGGRIHARA